MLHADPVPFQQPSAEGRTQQSLFGDPVAEHPLHVRVSGVSDRTVTLDMGTARPSQLLQRVPSRVFNNLARAVRQRKYSVNGDSFGLLLRWETRKTRQPHLYAQTGHAQTGRE